MTTDAPEPAPSLAHDIALGETCDRPQLMARVRAWFDAAQAVGLQEPASMVVSSVDARGYPNARVVLCRGIDDEGVRFFTNLQSVKGRELLARPRAAATFHWMPLKRQMRLQGDVHVVSDEAADAYWARRGRDSQLHAVISQQSRPLESRAAFEAQTAALDAKLNGAPVPRTAHWSGFHIVPHQVEFWTEGAARNHHREAFTLDDDGTTFRRVFLSP